MEIERKFLVDELPAELDERARCELRQGYLVIAPDGSEARVRSDGRRHRLTVKHGRGMARGEFEIELTSDQFERLWPATEGRRLAKTRYELPAVDGLVVDVYHGSLEGLKVAEVEFADRGAAESFEPPPWFGREVTDEPAYKNASLATRGVPPYGPGSHE